MKLSLILGYAAPYRLALGLSATMMVAESGVTLAVPWLGGRVAEGMLSRAVVNTGAVLLALLGLFAVQAVLRFGNPNHETIR